MSQALQDLPASDFSDLMSPHCSSLAMLLPHQPSFCSLCTLHLFLPQDLCLAIPSAWDALPLFTPGQCLGIQVCGEVAPYLPAVTLYQHLLFLAFTTVIIFSPFVSLIHL